MNKKENPHTFRYGGFPRRLAAAGAVRDTAAEARVTRRGRVEVVLQLVEELLERPVRLHIAAEFRSLDEQEQLRNLNEHLVVDLVSVHDTNLFYLCR